MTRTACFRGLLTLLVTVTLGCDDGPTTPSTIGRPPALNVTGTWAGLIGPPSSNVSLRATWTATQTGNNVTGAVSLFQPSSNLTFAGTLAATVSGTRLAVTYSVPRGSITGFPDCVIAGTGSLEASTTLMSGTLNVTYTNCQAFTAQTTATDEVTLTKQ